MSTLTGSAKVQSHWDQSASEEFLRDQTKLSWSGIGQIHYNHNYLVTGQRDYHWMHWMRERFFPGGDAGDTLSLGCGEGHVDRQFKFHGFRFRSFTGIDISPASVRKAQEVAEAEDLSPKTRYFVADLNNYRLPKQSYDFIYFFQSLHHVEALENLLYSCANALRPGGLMMVNEFVGPTRFQWTNDQLDRANHLLSLLPPELRVDLFPSRRGALKDKCVAFSLWEMMIGDPSESVRSEEIEPILKQYFDVVEEKNWGGTLNYLVFENIAGNFRPLNPLHDCIVELLIHHENELIANGVIPSNFKFYLVRPKPFVRRFWHYGRWRAAVAERRFRARLRPWKNKLFGRFAKYVRAPWAGPPGSEK